MKIKKVLLAVIVAIFAVIGCTSCGAKRIVSTNETTPTVVVTRPDYGENVKIHIIRTEEKRFKYDDSAEIEINEWLEQNKDKTIISIEVHYDEYNNIRYLLAIIVYRDNSTPTIEK